MDWAKYVKDETRNIVVLEFVVTNIRGLTVIDYRNILTDLTSRVISEIAFEIRYIEMTSGI